MKREIGRYWREKGCLHTEKKVHVVPREKALTAWSPSGRASVFVSAAVLGGRPSGWQQISGTRALYPPQCQLFVGIPLCVEAQICAE